MCWKYVVIFSLSNKIIKNVKLWHIQIMNLHYTKYTIYIQCQVLHFNTLYQAKFYFSRHPGLCVCYLTFLFFTYCFISHLDKCVYVSNSACLALNFIICDTKMSYSHSEMLMNFSTILHLKKRKITNFFIWLSKTILINFKTEFSWSLTFLAVYLYVYIPIHT